MQNCHIYFYDGWLSVAPTVISLAKILSKYFANIYIYMQKTQFNKYYFEEENIFPIYINNSFYWKKEDKPLNFEKKVLQTIKANSGKKFYCKLYKNNKDNLRRNYNVC